MRDCLTRAVTTLLCGVLATACSNSPLPTAPSSSEVAPSVTAGLGSPTTNSAPASSPSVAKYEQRFLMNMIDHHQMAVMTGQMCVEKAIHDELRQLCEGIVATQTREIETMQQWLSGWYGITYSPQMSKAMQREMQELASLTGAEFEIAFMEMMIAHHEGAVREGRTCVERAEHKQLIRLCERIIAAQTAEIEQMESWLCEWYARCG